MSKVNTCASNVLLIVIQVGVFVAIGVLVGDGVMVAVGVFVGVFVGEGVTVVGRMKTPLVRTEVEIPCVGVGTNGTYVT